MNTTREHTAKAPADTEFAARVREAVVVIRLDEQTAARDAFAVLIDELGRLEATRVWVKATDRVEAEAGGDPMLIPTRVAPDCVEACGESYINDCEPCAMFEQVRRPTREAVPFECGCGTVIPVGETTRILDHIDECTA